MHGIELIHQTEILFFCHSSEASIFDSPFWPLENLRDTFDSQYSSVKLLLHPLIQGGVTHALGINVWESRSCLWHWCMIFLSQTSPELSDSHNFSDMKISQYVALVAVTCTWVKKKSLKYLWFVLKWYLSLINHSYCSFARPTPPVRRIRKPPPPIPTPYSGATHSTTGTPHPPSPQTTPTGPRQSRRPAPVPPPVRGKPIAKQTSSNEILL